VTDTLVIGIGDASRRDDGAGAAVVAGLRQLDLPGNVRLETHWGEGASLIASWEGVARVILVDAMTSGAPAGTLSWFDMENLPPPGSFPYSTHRFGVLEGLQLALALGELPPVIHLLGIEGEDFSAGAGLTLEVEKGVERAVQEIAAFTAVP